MPRPARNFDCMLFKGMQGMHLLSIPVHLCCIIACISLLLPVPVMIQYCMGYYHTVLVLTHFNLALLVLPQPEVSVLTELPLLLNQILCCGSQGMAKARPRGGRHAMYSMHAWLRLSGIPCCLPRCMKCDIESKIRLSPHSRHRDITPSGMSHRHSQSRVFPERAFIPM